MTGIVVDDTGPCGGNEDVMGGEADRAGIVADTERRWVGMERMETGFVFGSEFVLALASEGGAKGEASGPNVPEMVDKGLADAEGKTGECG
jgi:hypothetical protein